MFEKINSINIDRFSVFAPMTAGLRSRLLPMPDGVTLVNNNEISVWLSTYNQDGGKSDVPVVNEFGQLVSALHFDGSFWLEFRDIMTPYAEKYNIVKAGHDGVERVISLPRESFQHEMPYHHLFTKDGGLYLHYIRHNRLHHYMINPKDARLDEIDVMEGGNWFLCGEYPLCHIRDTLELYDSNLTICTTIEYENSIDEVNFATSQLPYMFAVAVSDIAQEQTALVIYQEDSDSTHMAYLENTIAAMGASGGRVWLNPYNFQDQQDLGGCMIYDRFAWPLYVHLRSKTPGVKGIGPYPPPFHRCERFAPLSGGMTLAAEQSRLLVFDFACHPVQEIVIPHPECFAVNRAGDTLAVLNIDRSALEGGAPNIAENVTVDIYAFNADSEDSKVIEMAKFKR